MGAQGPQVGGPSSSGPTSCNRPAGEAAAAAMVPLDGFRPCSFEADVDSAAVPMTEKEEGRAVLAALIVHILDVSLDLLVVLLFLSQHEWGFLMCGAAVIFWSSLVSTLYSAFGSGQGPLLADCRDGYSQASQLSCAAVFSQLMQPKVCIEAYHCLLHEGNTDFFYTLRLMEAVLEAAPSTVVQLCALVMWNAAPSGAGTLMCSSVVVSLLSVSLSLAMWEKKVLLSKNSVYICMVVVMRGLEIASRSTTLALFAALTLPYGIWWVLGLDYTLMVFLIMRHQSVQLSYGLFVALPLVLVSLEPFVWRREDHAVPKKPYYAVRFVEFALMWMAILNRKAELAPQFFSNPTWHSCEVLAIVSTVGLYFLLPFVWRVARMNEFCQSVESWGEHGQVEKAGQDELFSDSEGVDINMEAE
eukprot:NODE_542_length_1490_cov_329.349826.p1 GENE.NODE_542_length_1490_cov_329.349826~~NODE_542_length_1490_cov_329.349826.p1  ORF type:complete len:415 (+),score=121.86 NODE_542_length_1490_cov_329.349826:3-1247(+)